MGAYIIANVNVQDATVFEEYRARVPETLARHGGRYVVRGGKHQTLEGNWAPSRLVLLEFPSVEHAKRWYDSEDYREPKALRMKCAFTDLVLVEGV
jgi:uncharacterized protein (DUF1330 family)